MPVLSIRRPPTIRSAVLGIAGATLALAIVGFLVATWFPAPHELVAFVRGGSLEGAALIPRADVLERVNGLGAAADLAPGLDASPWLLWRRYSVTAEGPVYVVRVRDTNADRGLRLTEAVRDMLVADLRRRYDAAMPPHRAYIEALQEELASLGAETKTLSARPMDATAARAAADRRVAVAQIRRQLRDAQVFAALSEVPEAVSGVRRFDPNQRARQIQLAVTGAVLGFAVAAVVFVTLAFRARSAHAFAGA